MPRGCYSTCMKSKPAYNDPHALNTFFFYLIAVGGTGPVLSIADSDCEVDKICTATCEVTGGKPSIGFQWTIGSELLDCLENNISPNKDNATLYDTNGTCTFTPKKEYNDKTLKCTTEGHEVTTLNSDASSLLNVMCEL